MSDRAYANAQAQQKTLSGPSPKNSVLQRTCACGQHTLAGGECEECRTKREGTLHRSQRAFEPPSAPGAVPGSSPAQENGASVNSAFDSASRFGHDFSQIPAHSPADGEIQTKLAINKPGDVYEQEADQVAEQVMATSAGPAVSSAPPQIQRISGKSNGQMDEAPTSIDQALASPGRPLEPALRQDMEQRFGYDFSQVRVHADDMAAESVQAVNALAYTVGRDVVFGAGRYAPQTASGKKLLAHELTHVIQQNEHTDHGRSIQRKTEICQDLPEVCLNGTPEIVAIPTTGNITVGREEDAALSAVQFEVKLNPKGDNPVDYRWSVKLVDPQHTIQVTEIKMTMPYQAYVRLKGLKQGQAKVFPMLEIRQRNRKTVHVEGKPFTVTVVPVDVLKEAGDEYRKYLSDYERYTRRWAELRLKKSKGEKVDEKIQEADFEEIKRYERARQKAEEAAKVALDVSKKKKVHDEIASLLENIDLAIERIETAKADGHHEAIMLLNAEELEKPSNANAFWIALAGNLLWAISGSLPWLAAGALAKMKLPKLQEYFKSSAIGSTHVATVIGTTGAMMAQFSAGLPTEGQRKAGLKKELLSYFGIINAHVANKQRRMSRLLLLDAMSKEPPTEKMDPIDYVAELSVGLRYTLYGDIYKEGLNDGALPDGARIKDFARDQLLHQYVAGTSTIAGGKIAPTAIAKLEGENLVEQAIKALGGQKVLLFEPYELVKNQLLKAATDIGVSIYEPYIDDLITELMAGRDYYVPITAPKRDNLVNLMDALIVCINDGGVSDYCKFAPEKEEAKPVVDSIISEGIDRIWVVNKAMNTIERNGQKMYSVQRFFLQPKHSTPTDEYQHLIYLVIR